MGIKKIKGKLSIFVLLILMSLIVNALEPSAPTNITVVSNTSPEPSVGAMLNLSGGTITTLTINATTQNPRWKGFVGNISGRFALQDDSSNELFSWNIKTITGEIYATKNSSIPDWTSIGCADNSIIEAEQNALNVIASNVDSINNTFSSSTHDEFYVGVTKVSQDSCKSIALNVNNTVQSSIFQEVLLKDNTKLMYTALLENSTYGFNNQSYDFQMIVAENALEGEQPNTAYYFYVELI